MQLISQFWFWLVLVSLMILALERLFPWRDQPLLRHQILQDWFWLLFNGHLASLLLTPLVYPHYQWLVDTVFRSLTGSAPQQLRLLQGQSLVLQFGVGLLVRDFIEYGTHYLLHRVPVLWRFHRVHHSIRTMDWIGNFRFHWFELLFYHMIKYLPLALLGIRWEVALAIGVFSLTVGHLNHANLRISWGPLRYVFNSPRMHIWHHDTLMHGKYGQNYAVVFSFWDWLFKTAWMPEGQPRRLGFQGDNRLPDNLLWRFFVPFLDRKTGPYSGDDSDREPPFSPDDTLPRAASTV